MSKCMSFCHLNVRSLTSNFNEFKDLIRSSRTFDVIALSETWLSSDVCSSSLAMDGFSLIRNDRGSRGGGVAFYIKTSLKYEIVDCNKNIEQLWVTHKICKRMLLVGVTYRPPGVNSTVFINELETQLSNTVPTFDDVVLMGDFNINMLGTGGHAAKSLLDCTNTLS